MDRKGMKVAAKKAQRKHYWMIVVICLVASVFGVAYTSSTLSVNINISVSAPQTEDSTQSNDIYGVLRDLAIGNGDNAREKSSKIKSRSSTTIPMPCSAAVAA